MEYMNKKTYILGFIAIALLGGIVWHADRNQEQKNDQISSILSTSQEESKSAIVSTQKVGEHVIGSPEAPVTMIEYSSHFCGHCVDFHEGTLPVLIDKYIKTGKVKLISRFISPPEIGLAILCAQEEDKFTEMSDHFFKNIEDIKTVEDVKKMGLEVASDKDNFEMCYDSKKYGDKVEEWFNSASEAGVTGTPSFFINGEKITGNQPVIEFEKLIEKALQAEE